MQGQESVETNVNFSLFFTEALFRVFVTEHRLPTQGSCTAARPEKDTPGSKQRAVRSTHVVLRDGEPLVC